MSAFIRVLVLLVLFSFPAQAEHEVLTGTGLVCNTADQIKRFVREISGNTEETLAAINADDPDACSVLSVAYISDSEVSAVSNRYGSFQIIAITVIGIITPFGIQPVQPVQQFTLVKMQGQGA